VEANADFYRTLGVEPDADGAAIRAAYRNLMRRYHPDVNQSEDAVAKATAINQAYACLGDEDRRAAYDGSRRPAAGPATSARRPTARRQAVFTPRSFAPIELNPPPTGWKVVSLGLALLVTIVTFTLTSATPPPLPPPPPTFVDMGAVQSARSAP
jgi:hypothetical protein